MSGQMEEIEKAEKEAVSHQGSAEPPSPPPNREKTDEFWVQSEAEKAIPHFEERNRRMNAYLDSKKKDIYPHLKQGDKPMINNHDKDCKCIDCLTKTEDCILSPLCKCEDCKDYSDISLAPDRL